MLSITYGTRLLTKIIQACTTIHQTFLVPIKCDTERNKDAIYTFLPQKTYYQNQQNQQSCHKTAKMNMQNMNTVHKELQSDEGRETKICTDRYTEWYLLSHSTYYTE